MSYIHLARAGLTTGVATTRRSRRRGAPRFRGARPAERVRARALACPGVYISVIKIV